MVIDPERSTCDRYQQARDDDYAEHQTTSV